MSLVFLPRLYGQGGLTIQEAVLSYMDRNYTGTELPVLLEHEMAHLYAVTFFPTGPRPPLILQEGWTVYLTGGHYRSGEPLQERAAVLVQSGRYIPLSDLADSFYSVQHETAYIEAVAFVEFLAGRFGDERVLAMFRERAAAGSPAAALDSMLRTHFQTTLAECEAAWLDGLRRITPDPDQVRDVEFTLEMFDALRRYQRLYDPGGSMADFWLPDLSRARAEQISADYLPPPGTADSITLETVFLAARTAADAREWDRARETMEAIERVLDATQRRAPDPISVSSLAGRYRSLVDAIRTAGDEPLRIELSENRADAETRDPTSLKKEVQLSLIHI